jgi:hypothetical protein
VSRQFALKNNLPTLNHVTVPRVGAVQNIVAVTSSVNRSNGHVHSVHGKAHSAPNGLRFAVITSNNSKYPGILIGWVY